MSKMPRKQAREPLGKLHTYRALGGGARQPGEGKGTEGPPHTGVHGAPVTSRGQGLLIHFTQQTFKFSCALPHTLSQLQGRGAQSLLGPLG